MNITTQTADVTTLELIGWTDRLAKVRDSFIQSVTDDGASYATQWKLADLLEAETKAGLEVALLPEGLPDPEAIAGFMHSMERHMLDVRGESKSTSALTNVAEDVRFAVRAHLYSKLLEAQRVSD